jgi:hypothetical protein
MYAIKELGYSRSNKRIVYIDRSVATYCQGDIDNYFVVVNSSLKQMGNKRDIPESFNLPGIVSNIDFDRVVQINSAPF